MINWRKWNKVLHRDLGYLCFGLTIIYVVSGVAVNHIADWNPTYSISREKITLSLQQAPDAEDELVRFILEQLGETGELIDSYRPEPDSVKIFVADNTITVNLDSGVILQEKVRKRPLLFQANFLHLNHPKRLWTWFADIYALALGMLSLTGLFMLSGRKGLAGRGAWLVSAGLGTPLFFLWLYG